MIDATSKPAWPFLSSDIDTLDKSFFAFAKNHYSVGLRFFFVAGILAVTGFVLEMLHQAFGPILLLPSIIYAGGFSAMVGSKMNKDFAQHFATIIGYSFSDSAALASVAGDLFGVGHSQAISDVLSGSYQGLPVRLFQYNFTTGSGKSQQTHIYVILEVQFDHSIPPVHVVPADAKLSELVLDDRTIDAHTSSPMKISLEGDFNKYFSVYAPENTQIEDLEVMSPDFMAFLIDHYDAYKDAGFECHDVRLYIHLGGTLNSKKIKDFSAMYSLADTLIPKLQQIKI